MKHSLALLVVVMAVPGSLHVYAAESEWKAGLAAIKITPETPVPMAGYASRVKPYERVEQDIYAKALALEDGEGHRAVLVTTDLLGLPRAVAEPVCKRVQEKTSLARSQILLHSAHTHSAQTLRLNEDTESGTAAEDRTNIIPYTHILQDQPVTVTTQAAD